MSVYIIAEAGVNHNGNIDIAKKLIDEAFLAGCDAVKFQTFKADSIVTKTADKAKYQISNTGIDESQYQMLKKLELGITEHKILFEYCNQKGIEFISTPFDEESSDMLYDLGVRLFKISSGDLTNKPFLTHVAKKGRPIMISTGMSYLHEVKKALSWIYETGNQQVTLLHCTSKYPTPMEHVNLNAMVTMEREFKLPTGYSDHTEGIEIPIAAVSLGAVVIEKHFTLDRSMPGPDHKASLEPKELAKMVQSIRQVEKALGNGEKVPAPGEEEIAQLVRKSIVTAVEVKKGQIITIETVKIKRPGTGISPQELEKLMGRTFNRDLPEDHVITMEDIYGDI